MTEFTKLLRELLPLFQSQKKFAEAIGLTPSRFSKVMRGEYTLDVRNCLKLAEIANQPPTRILRAAGKHEIAELLVRLYDASPISPAERDLLQKWSRIPDHFQKQIVELVTEIDLYTKGSPATATQGRHRHPKRKIA